MKCLAIETLKEEFINIKNHMESQFGQPDLVEYLPTKMKDNEQEQREIWEITDSPDQEEYPNPSYAKKQKTLVLDNFQVKGKELIFQLVFGSTNNK